MTGECKPYILAHKYKSYLTLNIWNKYKKKNATHTFDTWLLWQTTHTYIYIHTYFFPEAIVNLKDTHLLWIFTYARSFTCVICMHVSSTHFVYVCMNIRASSICWETIWEKNTYYLRKKTLYHLKLLTVKVFKKLNPRLCIFFFFFEEDYLGRTFAVIAVPKQVEQNKNKIIFTLFCSKCTKHNNVFILWNVRFTLKDISLRLKTRGTRR